MLKSPPQSSRAIRVFILDDHRLLAEAMALVMEHEGDLQVVGMASSCAAALSLIVEACPDVILLDVALPDGDGLNLIPRLERNCPQARILVLTSFANESTLLRAMEAGVSGFVAKDRPVAEVLTAIRQAAAGEIVMPPSLLIGLLDRTQRIGAKPKQALFPEALTPRQREILVLTSQGKSAVAIAKELNLSTMTVRTHLRNLMERLQVHSRLEAVVFALHHGLINTES